MLNIIAVITVNKSHWNTHIAVRLLIPPEINSQSQLPPDLAWSIFLWPPLHDKVNSACSIFSLSSWSRNSPDSSFLFSKSLRRGSLPSKPQFWRSRWLSILKWSLACFVLVSLSLFCNRKSTRFNTARTWIAEICENKKKLPDKFFFLYAYFHVSFFFVFVVWNCYQRYRSGNVDQSREIQIVVKLNDAHVCKFTFAASSSTSRSFPFKTWFSACTNCNFSLRCVSTWTVLVIFLLSFNNSCNINNN